mmetsp:Transcript_21384/g.70699  ORF Transcript_21384/g.70699 Transcript_21384/m.70699 type:complete len:245 (-) Transcript_21384:406-1140(-)
MARARTPLMAPRVSSTTSGAGTCTPSRRLCDSARRSSRPSPSTTRRAWASRRTATSPRCRRMPSTASTPPTLGWSRTTTTSSGSSCTGSRPPGCTTAPPSSSPLTMATLRATTTSSRSGRAPRTTCSRACHFSPVCPTGLGTSSLARPSLCLTYRTPCVISRASTWTATGHSWARWAEPSRPRSCRRCAKAPTATSAAWCAPRAASAAGVTSTRAGRTTSTWMTHAECTTHVLSRRWRRDRQSG